MTVEEIAAWLREMSDFSTTEVETAVYVSQECYFDLGQFGESYTDVEIEDGSYPISVETIFDAAPDSPGSFIEMAEMLEALAAKERELAVATVGGASTTTTSGIDVKVTLTRSSEAPLPEEPAPWPGALRDDIDYCDKDFIRRYLPPPGFVWGNGSGFSPSTPLLITNPTKSRGRMVMDEKGRVSWMQRGDSKMEGDFWGVWMDDARSHLPKAQTFTSTTPPRSLDAHGKIIPESSVTGEHAKPNFNWRTHADAERAAEILKDVVIEAPAVATPKVESTPGVFDPPAPVSL